MEGKIVFQGKSDKGKQLIIRYPTKADLNAMWEYINTLSKEKTFIRYRGEKISLKEESEFLTKELEEIAKNQAIFLLAFYKEKLIGASGIDMKDKIEKHLGVFGVTIAKEFRGEGIGSILMENVINEAVKKLSDLEIIILGVYKNNVLAKQMYKKFGFLEYGTLPKGIKLEDGYVDHTFMYKIIRS